MNFDNIHDVLKINTSTNIQFMTPIFSFENIKLGEINYESIPYYYEEGYAYFGERQGSDNYAAVTFLMSSLYNGADPILSITRDGTKQEVDIMAGITENHKSSYIEQGTTYFHDSTYNWEAAGATNVVKFNGPIEKTNLSSVTIFFDKANFTTYDVSLNA